MSAASAVSAFVAGHALPLRGTDPMGGPPRPFSVAPFPPRAGQAGPPGLLYMLSEDDILDLMDYLLSKGNPEDPMFEK